MKYLQTLDCSNNFLSQAAELESCPLLGVLKLQGNNLQKVSSSVWTERWKKFKGTTPQKNERTRY